MSTEVNSRVPMSTRTWERISAVMTAGKALTYEETKELFFECESLRDYVEEKENREDDIRSEETRKRVELISAAREVLAACDLPDIQRGILERAVREASK